MANAVAEAVGGSPWLAALCLAVGLALLATAYGRVARRKADPNGWYPNGPVEQTMPDGEQFRAPDKMVLSVLWREIFENKCYDSNLLKIPEGPSTVVDVGGNIGVFARYCASKYPQCSVHSVEPIAPMYAMLKHNTRDCKNVTLHNCGLTSLEAGASTVSFHYFPGLPGNGTMKFQERQEFQNRLFSDTEKTAQYLREHELPTRGWLVARIMGLLPNNGAGIAQSWFAKRAAESIEFPCEVRTLSSVLEQEGIGNIDLLKVDVEGAELDVLKGLSREHWPKVQQVVAEVHDVDERVADMRSLLEGVGFEVQVVHEDMFRVLEQPTYMLYARRPS